jgi:hypothetical protein
MKKFLPMIVVAVVVGVAAFFGGSAYGKSHAASGAMAQFGGRGNFGGQAGAGRRAGMGGGLTAGQIISEDAMSLTVQIPQGGSKIVFFSPTTNIVKSVAGTAADLKVGVQVVVTGAVNSDGSIAAQSIQLRTGMPRATSTQQ